MRKAKLGTKLGGLGKGLDDIFVENSSEDDSYVYLKISDVEPNKNQPRNTFDEESLRELADSITNYGILQPLIVRPILGTGSYKIIAGERRWRAARMAGKKEVPAIVREFTEKEQAEVALIENLQREDLSPLEEAAGYKALIDSYSLTQEQISKSVGKSRSAITNSLRLLTLPTRVREKLSDGSISVGHARTLLSLQNEEQMNEICDLIIEKKLSVREVESLCKRINTKMEKTFSGSLIEKTRVKDSVLTDIEVSLKRSLGRNVNIISKSANKGLIQFEFYGNEDLLNLLKVFKV